MKYRTIYMVLLLLVVITIMTPGIAQAKGQKFSGTGYTIVMPAGWEMRKNIGAAEVAVLSPREGAADKFRDNILVGKERLPRTIGLDEYLDISIKNIKKQLKQVKILSRTKLTVSGKPARKIVLTHVMGGNKVKAAQVYVINDKMAYVIALSSVPKDYAKFDKIFNSVVRTFKFD